MAQDQLTSSRLEAFSDGVIAVIITIMVLELKVPARTVANAEALHAVMPLVLVYLLSFVQVGIYWVNHHYMIDDIDHVSHGILWANLVFLFCLSLFPFATNWVAERGISSFSIALYGAASVLPAITWNILSRTISRFTGIASAASRLKQAGSTTLYLGSIPAAYISPFLALAMLIAVAILWLIPPPRVVATMQAVQPAAKPSATPDHSR